MREVIRSVEYDQHAILDSIVHLHAPEGFKLNHKTKNTRINKPMKYLPINPTIVLLTALLVCGLMESLPAANQKHRGAAIQNATESAMPMARKQKVGDTRIYTARAKSGYTFAVKNGKVLYMDVKRATKLSAKLFSMSHLARKEAAKFTK